MTTIRTEREAKFEGSGVFDPGALRGLPGVARIREEAAEELDAIYYDTADLRLLTHGITLRRRRGGHDAGWHVKMPKPQAHRGNREIHAPLKAGKAGAVPPELARRLAAFARGGPLTPVAHVRTHRRRHVLLDKKGRPLAEVAQDRVAAQVLGTERLGAAAKQDSADTSTRLTHWFEIEVELEDGGPRLLDAAARRLADAGWYPSPSAHKLDHTLAEELPAARERAGASRRKVRPGSAGEAIMRRLDQQVTALLDLDPGVRADEADAVHGMRTASRRIRNLLRSHRRLLDRDRTEPVVRELAWLSSLLAPARDHEVLADRLPDHMLRLGPEHRAAARRIGKQERERHDTAWRTAVLALDEPRYFALLDALDALRADPPLRRRARKPALAQLSKAAARDHHRLARRIAAAQAAPAGEERDVALHAARKAARRVRHTAETALPYAGKRARRLRKRAKAVQQVLGEHQDAVVARAALPTLAVDAHRAGANTFAYGLLRARQDDLAERAGHALPHAWHKARKRRLTRLT
ncbi:CYTH and CHAD domain-containing protein [Actinacidiphila alni]|uniref:CYTH and CHAD domain-containing protein n=1 Tax=Actinacidiphila alni TaxID=380248 RepID=UPI003455CDD5